MAARIGASVEQFTEALRHNTGVGSRTDAHRRAVFRALQFANERTAVPITHLSDVFDKVDVPRRRTISTVEDEDDADYGDYGDAFDEAMNASSSSPSIGANALSAAPAATLVVGHTASSSAIATAMLRESQMPVVLKASLRDSTRVGTHLDNALFVEAGIYSLTMARLFDRMATPHIVLALSVFILSGCEEGKLFSDPDIELRSNVAERFASNMSTNIVLLNDPEMTRSLIENKKIVEFLARQPLRLVALERSTGHELHYWLRVQSVFNETDEGVLDEWRTVLFQLIYTLACFIEIGLSHNDMHMGNVWLERVETRQVARYAVSQDLAYVTKSPLSVRIYDFDRATKVPTRYDATLLENYTLDAYNACHDAGECHRTADAAGDSVISTVWKDDNEQGRKDARLNTYHDLYTVLSNVYKAAERAPTVRSFVERAVAPSWLSETFQQQLRHPGHLCFDERDYAENQRPCRAPLPWALNDVDPSRPNMRTPHYLLASDPFFAPLTEPPNIDRMVYDNCYELPSLRAECGGSGQPPVPATRKRARK